MAARPLEQAVNPLITKLQNVSSLSDDDRAAIVAASTNTRQLPARRDIISDGDEPNNVHLMLDGWAARYKVVGDGSRQITAFLIPGDFCDLHVAILKKMDHAILALTPATVAYISHEKMHALMEERPTLTRALWWATLVDEGTLRSWIVNIGRRDGYERVGHLFCELHLRLKNIGLADDGIFELPITQEEIADALGLTPVHVNRMLQRLRGDKLIERRGKTITLLDPEKLSKAAGFDASYLHGQGQLRSQ